MLKCMPILKTTALACWLINLSSAIMSILMNVNHKLDVIKWNALLKEYRDCANPKQTLLLLFQIKSYADCFQTSFVKDHGICIVFFTEVTCVIITHR